MNFAHQRIVDLTAGERNGFEPERGETRRCLRRQCHGMAERHQGESHFALGIDIKQGIDRASANPLTTLAGRPSAVATASRLARRVPLSHPKWR